MKCYFIRHGQTAGNAEKRYIGRTDEPLSEIGKMQVEELSFPLVDRIYCSPMLRCRQTAEILFGTQDIIIEPDFRETDFGIFEGKNAEELEDSQEYRAWVESGCQNAIPEGESISAFKKRCCHAFQTILSQCQSDDTIALVVHGGTIMAILEQFGDGRDFYAYHIGNAQYLECVKNDENYFRVVY